MVFVGEAKKHGVWRQKMYFFIKMNLKKLCFPHDFLRFPHFESKTDFSMKFLNDSAWLCVEISRNTVLRPQNLRFNQKYKKKNSKIPKNPRFS